MKQKLLILFTLLLSATMMRAQNCTINAGGNQIICGTTVTLSGSGTGSSSGNPTWTLISKPVGATDPVIANGNTHTPNISALNTPGNYVFRISQACTTGGTVSSDVTITAPGAVNTFTAGPDRTNITAATGVANLNGVIPAGYTASWTYYNLYSFERYNNKVTTNATLTGTTTANPVLTLTNKSNHDIDPSYAVILKITSTFNPNCSYQDTAIVRFIPNPQILINNISFCSSPSNPQFTLFLTSASPKFATQTPGSSGNPAYGTSITMNVVSQPAGGAIAFNYLDNNVMLLNGVNVTGLYRFSFTIVNAAGSYTTPVIDYMYNGVAPNLVEFTDPAYPNQLAIYGAAGSAGAHYCGKAGNTDPVVVRFKINPSDPASITSMFTNSGIVPPGGSPSIVLSGAGTYNRSATITPPSGGWRVGTYRFSVSTSNGSCNSNVQNYYIHISDGSRPAVAVNNVTVCYPGSGTVAATVNLPAVYKGVVNASYFQDFNAHYELTNISKPAGAGVPVLEANNLRSINNTSTVISNLTTQGEYVFVIKPIPSSAGVADFLDKEYACSGTSIKDTFSIFVTTQINSNAGSDKNISCTTSSSLLGNNPGVASGMWTLVSAPSGATPVITNPSQFNSAVTNLNVLGTYRFRWTISTGTCTNFDEANLIVGICKTVAVDDIYVMNQGGTITLTPLVNDTNSDGFPLTVVSINGVNLTPGTAQVIPVPNGIVNVAANGTITFTPNATYTGTVTFPYTITDGNGGTATANEIIFISAGGPLPVKITSFNVSKTGDKTALLSWATASEQNNKGFTIERSADGITWNSIGFVNSKAVNGNSNTTLNYSFEDNAPLSAVNYYRLKQVDLDGSVEYSDMRILNFDAAAKIKVYPNPAAEWVTIDGLGGKETINIYSAEGRLVKKERTNSSVCKINVTSFASGMYNVIVTDATGKIIAQRTVVKGSN